MQFDDKKLHAAFTKSEAEMTKEDRFHCIAMDPRIREDEALLHEAITLAEGDQPVGLAFQKLLTLLEG